MSGCMSSSRSPIGMKAGSKAPGNDALHLAASASAATTSLSADARARESKEKTPWWSLSSIRVP